MVARLIKGAAAAAKNRAKAAAKRAAKKAADAAKKAATSKTAIAAYGVTGGYQASKVNLGNASSRAAAKSRKERTTAVKKYTEENVARLRNMRGGGNVN